MNIQELRTNALNNDESVRELDQVNHFDTINVNGRCIIVFVQKDKTEPYLEQSVSYISDTLDDFAVDIACEDQELTITVQTQITNPIAFKRHREKIIKHKTPLCEPDIKHYKSSLIPVFFIRKDKVSRIICSGKADVRLFNLNQNMLLAETDTGSKIRVFGVVKEFIGVLSTSASEFNLVCDKFPKRCIAKSKAFSNIKIGAIEHAQLKTVAEGRIRFKGSFGVADFNEADKEFIRFNLRDVFTG